MSRRGQCVDLYAHFLLFPPKILITGHNSHHPSSRTAFHWAYVTIKLGCFYSFPTKMLYFDFMTTSTRSPLNQHVQILLRHVYCCYSFLCFILYLFCAPRFASLWHPRGHRNSESATTGSSHFSVWVAETVYIVVVPSGRGMRQTRGLLHLPLHTDVNLGKLLNLLDPQLFFHEVDIIIMPINWVVLIKRQWGFNEIIRCLPTMCYMVSV